MMVARGKSDRMNWRVIVRAMITATALCTSALVSAAEGGVISFIGAVVEPPFEVMAASAEAAVLPRVAAIASRSGVDASAMSVTFAVFADSRPSARISIEAVKNSTTPAATAACGSVRSVFADGSGRKTAPDRNGEYHVGRAGGTLLLTSAAAVKSAVAPLVTVVSQYN
ncbi:hypothetical protein GCT13_29540 [Paraburkholderia sp. CNPSo 3157]|uniref:Uncharacterized protein n=1 Tax=Paraburkholderia franconis TaxID=2654983 RepID=A0A7X1NG24_9BURK|nr:hypothetical protein [Paraburkholderia franconis]MPW20901.1 hypothetical protein [Paraburkholderia franconis]